MNIIYGVSSVGLGHARRSRVLAEKLRDLFPGIEIDWIAAEPAGSFLRHSGESVLEVSQRLNSLSPAMEQSTAYGRLHDMSSVARVSYSIARTNYFLLRDLLRGYDALIEDEFAETMFSFMWDKKTSSIPKKSVIITDYVRFESGRLLNPLKRLVLWYANRMLERSFQNATLAIFAENEGAVPPKLRVRVRQSSRLKIVGPILPEPPTESRDELRSKLGFEHSKALVVVTVGGTAIGKHLIDFIVENSATLSEHLNCTFAVLLGPRIPKSSFGRSPSDATRLVEFTPNSLEYFKAADCVLAQAGGSTLNEVASVGTPCVAVPILGHFEQEANAKRFKERFGFEVLDPRGMSVESLELLILKSLQKASRDPMTSTGAETAAELIYGILAQSNIGLTEK